MTPREIALDQLHHKETDLIPFTLWFDEGTDRQLDEHYGTADWRAWMPNYITVVSNIDQDRRVPLDETHYRDAFGSVWDASGRPMHLARPGLQQRSFEGYEFPSADCFVDAELERQALETCRRHADSLLLGHFGWGVFERTWTIRGLQEALVDLVEAPEFYEELLDRITQLHLRFVEALVRLPIDGILFSDDWGGQQGVLMGPARWRRLVKPRVARLYQAAHDAGKLALSHCCGNVVDIMDDIVEIGLDGLESVQPEAMSPYELKRRWGRHLAFWGGLGSQSTIPFGTRSTIFEEVRRLCTEMTPGGGFILAPAKPIQPGTPPENAAAVLEAFLEFTGHREWAARAREAAARALGPGGA